jgi:hypothetical protein
MAVLAKQQKHDERFPLYYVDPDSLLSKMTKGKLMRLAFM